MNPNTNEYNQEGHSHSILYIGLGCSLGAAILLLFVVGIIFLKGSGSNKNFQAFNSSSNPTTVPSTKTSVTPTPPLASNTQKVVPVLIQNQKDLNDALKAYDDQSTDTAIEEAISKNSTDVSSFSN